LTRDECTQRSLEHSSEKKEGMFMRLLFKVIEHVVKEANDGHKTIPQREIHRERRGG
jgi:hypothetical protein